VGLSFGSVPSTLVIPFTAISGFADPQVRLVLRFTVPESDQPAEPARPQAAPPAVQAPAKPEAAPPAESAAEDADPAPQVVSLDAFRRRGPPS
jgi:hypothetical protein